MQVFDTMIRISPFLREYTEKVTKLTFTLCIPFTFIVPFKLFEFLYHFFNFFPVIETLIVQRLMHNKYRNSVYLRRVFFSFSSAKYRSFVVKCPCNLFFNFFSDTALK